MDDTDTKPIIGVNPGGPTGRAFEGGGFDTETGAVGTIAGPIDDPASPREERERGGTDIFFAAVEATRMPMIVTDPRQPDNPIVFCNPAFVQMTGYELHEIEGRNCRFLQGPESDREVVAELRRAIEERREISVELLNYRKNGSAFWNALFMSPVFDKDGELVYYFASQLDVSRRRDAEDALRQAQKMEALGQLTGGIAHDFNNLLQVIVGYLDGLKARGADVPPEYLQRAVDAMALAADRGATLTQQLLAFARKQRLDGRLVNLNGLIEGLEPLITRTLGPTVTVEHSLAPDLPNTKLDSTQAELALLNVLINARDAMDGHGRIAIETGTCDVEEAGQAGELAPGRYVELVIRDTGSGIPPEILKRVTEPFFTTKEQGRGTGLGLSMVYGFAKQSGGSLRLQSEVGRGTTVRMLFPAVDAPRDPLAAAPRLPDRGRHAECVLIVEDQEDVGDLAQSILEDFGYRVLRAANGGDALAIVEGDERIDLLFTDLIMPGGMNGVTLAREAKRARPRLRVLLTTGYAERSGATEDAAGSEFDLIAKPYRRSDLAARVRRAIDGPTGVS